MATRSETAYSATLPAQTIDTSWTLIQSIDFTPVTFENWLIMGYAAAVDSSEPLLADPYNTTEREADFAMVVNGTTVNECTDIAASFIYLGTTSITLGQSNNVSLYSKSSNVTGLEIRPSRLMAFGVKDYEIIDLEDESVSVAGTSTKGSKILMHYPFYPKYTDYLAFSYVECGKETASVIKSTYQTYFDNIDKDDTKLLSSTIPFYYGANKWNCLASVEKISLERGLHRFYAQADKIHSTDSNPAKFRRMRTILLPLVKEPFSTVQSIQELGRDALTGREAYTDNTVVGLSTLIGITTSVVKDHKYLAIASARQSPSVLNKYGKMTARYVGLNLYEKIDIETGEIIPPPTYTEPSGLDDLFNIGTMYNAASGDPGSVPLFGKQVVGFHFAQADETKEERLELNSDFNRTFNSGPSNSDSESILLEHTNLILCKFASDSDDVQTGPHTIFNETYGLRTLIEINNSTKINRYSLDCDTYLFSGVTSGVIVDKIVDGSIDLESVLGLLVTGQQVVNAVAGNDLETARQLIDLQVGLPEGATTSSTSEYNTFDGFGCLYKKQVLKQISITEEANETFYGVLSTNSIKLQLSLSEAEFLQDNPLEQLRGNDLVVRFYDPINGTLRTRASGKIVDVDISNGVVSILASNPNLDVLNAEIPNKTISHAKFSQFGEKGINVIKNEGANIYCPVFFGVAKRVPIPLINKDYGTDNEGLVRGYRDAFADYFIGGPLFNSTFQSVVAITSETNPTGIYRNWVSVLELEEFNNKTTVVEFDKYTLNSRASPSLRFVAVLITSEEHSGLQGLPLPYYDDVSGGAIDINRIDPESEEDKGKTDYRLYGDELTPVIRVLRVAGYPEGKQGWVNIYGNEQLASTIFWWAGENIVGLTHPPANPVRFTPIVELERFNTTPEQELIGTNLADPCIVDLEEGQYSQVLFQTGITQVLFSYEGEQLAGSVIYNKDEHFTATTNHPFRELEDIIVWNKVANPRAIWAFTGVTTDISEVEPEIILQSTGNQPTYSSFGEALEFPSDNGEDTGKGALWTDSDKMMFQNDEEFRIEVFVSANSDYKCQGTVVSKYQQDRGAGFNIQILAQTAIPTIDGGDPAKFAACAQVSHGSGFASLYPSVTTTPNMADGSIHKIELRVKRNFADNGNDYVTLHIDNVLAADSSTVNNVKLAASSPFTIGAVYPETFRNAFEGKIYKVVCAEDGAGKPDNNSKFGARWAYIPDAFQAEWLYRKVEASNPIPIDYTNTEGEKKDDISIVAGDFRVAGSEIEAESLQGTISGLENGTVQWIGDSSGLGYSLRFNYGAPEIGWYLGTAELGVDTYLGGLVGSTYNGTVEFLNNSTLMQFNGNFSMYAYATWRGGTDQSGYIMAKSFGSVCSYGLGIRNGHGYGVVRSLGRTYNVEGITPLDLKTPYLIMVEREGNLLKLYINGKLDGVAYVGKSEASDYDTGSLVISPALDLGGWIGDISFIGLADFAGGETFAKLQLSAVANKVKGMYSEKYSQATGQVYGTKIHIPLVEGSGTAVYNRNLHRNPATTIKRILTDSCIGLNHLIDACSFNVAEAKLDDLGLKVDFVQITPRKVIDILSDICMVRGLLLRKNSFGAWAISVDDYPETTAAKFGSGDGNLNNISVKTFNMLSIDKSIKTLRLSYAYYPDSEGDDTYHKYRERLVHDFGSDIKNVENPYILDDETADKVVDYLSKKLKQEDRGIVVECGSEATDLNIHDLVEVTVPYLNIYPTFAGATVSGLWQVRAIERKGFETTLDLLPFDTSVYIWDPGGPPQEFETLDNNEV